jgi:hypothetical protein
MDGRPIEQTRKYLHTLENVRRTAEVAFQWKCPPHRPTLPLASFWGIVPESREEDMTIADAAQKALKSLNRPASIKEVYAVIEKEQLFQFKAKDPVGVLSSSIRKHTKGSKTLRGSPIFEQVAKGTFRAL